MVLVFIDFGNAFNTVNHRSMLQALADCRITHSYPNPIENIYKKANAVIKVHLNSSSFKIKEVMRQCDAIFTNLFTFLSKYMKYIFKRIEIPNFGVNSTDDLVIISDQFEEAKEMLIELEQASIEVGLNIIISKTMFIQS